MLELLLLIFVLYWLFGRGAAPSIDIVVIIVLVLILFGGVGHFATHSTGWYY